MKFSTVYTNRIGHKKQNEPIDKLLILNFIFLASGIIVGSCMIFISKEGLTVKAEEIFKEFFNGISALNSKDLFVSIAFSNVLFYIILIIFSFGITGTVLIPIYGFYKTVGIGLYISYLYCTFGLSGIEFALLVILPGKFFLILSMMILMNVSERFSFRFLKLWKGEKCEKASGEQFLMLGVSLIFYLISVTTDYALLNNFTSLFSFF